MSASEEDSKIDLLDDPAAVKKKLERASEDGLLSFSKSILFPLIKNGEKFTVPRTSESGKLFELIIKIFYN